MANQLALLAAALVSLAAQLPAPAGVPRLWTDEALAGWALPVAGVKATPKFFTEAESYAAPVDEVPPSRWAVSTGSRSWVPSSGSTRASGSRPGSRT